MGKVCKKSWIAAIFLGVMLFAAGFAFQASTVDAQAATTGFRTEKHTIIKTERKLRDGLL